MNDTTEREPGGALDELANEPSSRKRFLGMVGGAGAAGALAIFVAACGGDDEEQSSAPASDDEKAAGGVDLEIVNYALTLEHLEADFYAAVISSGVVSDKAVGEAAKRIGENEREHVEVLRATAKKLGSPPRSRRRTFRG